MSADEFSRLYTLISNNHVEVVQRLTEQETLMRGLPERVTDLERTRWTWEGARLALAGLVSFAVGYFKAPR